MTTHYPEVWDLDVFFEGGSASPAFRAHLDALPQQIDTLAQTVQQLQLTSENDAPTLRQALEDIAHVSLQMRQAAGFISCLTAQNTQDKEALVLQGQLSSMRATFAPVHLTLQQRLTELDDALFHVLLAQPSLAEFTFILTEMRETAKLELSPKEEALISALQVDGYEAWGQYYNLLISDLKVQVEVDGQVQTLSVGQANNLSSHPDVNVRKAAFEALEQMFTEREEFFAKVLNHLGGFRLATYEKRGWDNVLDEPLRINRMQQQTLDAMWQAIHNNKQPFVDFLQKKAQLFGADKMDWYNFDAPITENVTTMPYSEGAQFILTQFEKFGPELANFARTAFEDGWIEAENRDNKRPGGFCTGLPMSEQSRIFMTYSGTMSNISTLAHELGHAFHSYALRPVHVLNRSYAMNVAETASTFAEMIVSDAAVQAATTKAEKLNLLEDKIQRSVAFFMNIHARFLFETRFYEERKVGVVSAKRLNELMQEAQHEAFGGALGEAHPHFWASKMHFYITGVPFYNFPYTFGYLFSLSIYAHAQQQGTSFEQKYMALLRDTAVMTVEELAMKHLGEDITTLDFWEKGIALCVADVEAFIQLIQQG
ncbi:MAG: M3 family oligoendopeptidase [Caryophanon sp.]|nr:M3 family oligoendopeptidase [Caryophanon sp.]